VPVGEKDAGNAGTLAVSFRKGSQMAAGFVGARTGAPAPGGGGYGLFYPAVGASSRASDAWIFGLQQNASVRSNLAIASPGGADFQVHVDVHDGDTGRLAGRLFPQIPVPPPGQPGGDGCR